MDIMIQRHPKRERSRVFARDEGSRLGFSYKAQFSGFLSLP